MSFKAFVSENQLEENRKTRQAEWEKVRKPDDPEEAPEPVYDPRSLFDRLQEQKIKKQEEFEESRRLKNLICVLDQDESSFLEMVDKNKMEEEIAKAREERVALEEFRKAIEGLTSDDQESKISEFKKTFSLKGRTRKSTKRNINGSLANLIKIKKTSSGEGKEITSTSTTPPPLNNESDNNNNQNQSKVTSPIILNKPATTNSSVKEIKVKQPTLKTCLVDYGSDSEEEEEEQDSDSQEYKDETINHPNKKSKLTEYSVTSKN